MITRYFYRFAEVVERLGTDAETLRQAVALEKVAVFLEFNQQTAWLPCGNRDEIRRKDPYGTWGLSADAKFDDEGELEASLSEPVRCTISGWFRASKGCTIHAARSGVFEGRNIWVHPSFTDPELWTPWSPAFVVTDLDRSFESAWFLATEIDALSGRESLIPTKWPWGGYETKALLALSAAAKELWTTYDSDMPTTAWTNKEVAKWLRTERGVKPRMANAIATILRADDAPVGRRPKSR